MSLLQPRSILLLLIHTCPLSCGNTHAAASSSVLPYWVGGIQSDNAASSLGQDWRNLSGQENKQGMCINVNANKQEENEVHVCSCACA